MSVLTVQSNIMKFKNCPYREKCQLKKPKVSSCMAKKKKCLQRYPEQSKDHNPEYFGQFEWFWNWNIFGDTPANFALGWRVAKEDSKASCQAHKKTFAKCYLAKDTGLLSVIL